MQYTTPLTIANWKMNPQTESEARELVAGLKKAFARKVFKGDVALAAPFVFLPFLARECVKSPFLVAAQDVSPEKMGAFTGEVSALQLKSLGVGHVIVGHSERRARGEGDALVAQKVFAALKSDLTTVLCVGERERDTHGKYFSFVEGQVKSALAGVPASKLAQLAIAYEPIWAISTSSAHARAATPDDAHEMILFIRRVLTDLYGRTAAERVRILYGGSVDQKNIVPLVARSGAQGYLVGGASLRLQDFTTILKVIYG